MGLAITFGLGLFFFLGVIIIKGTADHDVVERASLSLAFGSMVAIGLFDLIPEVLEIFSGVYLLLGILFVAGGVLLLKGLDHFIPEHDDDEDDEPTEGNLVHIGVMSAMAIILHNILEGMAVYNIAMADMRQGVTVAIGVGLHNIPMGMMIYATLHHEPRFKKHLVLFLSAISTFVGGLFMALMSDVLSETAEGFLLCIALGMLIYIVVFELLPFLIKNRQHRLSVIGSLLGFGIVMISLLLG